MSTNGKFKVQINWTPADIGKNSKFLINITDASGNQLKNTKYHIMQYKEIRILINS